MYFEQATRKQRRVLRSGRQLATRAYQQHVHGLAQAGELALVIEHDGLDAGALGYEPEQP